MKAHYKYSQTVQNAFIVSKATLDLSKCEDAVQVRLTSENGSYLLCTLGKKTPQVKLNLKFEEGDQICFYTKGEGVVHLIGHFMPMEASLQKRMVNNYLYGTFG